MFTSRPSGHGSSAQIRGILDGGSQRTFITKDLVAKLGLKVVAETSVALNAFAWSVTSEVVELRLGSQFEDAEQVIQAITVPTICPNVPYSYINDAFAARLRESHHRLADERTVPDICEEPGVSLLIGSYQMWRIVTGDMVRCHEVNGLLSLKTTLRWTLQGPAQKQSTISGPQKVTIGVLQTQVLQRACSNADICNACLTKNNDTIPNKTVRAPLEPPSMAYNHEEDTQETHRVRTANNDPKKSILGSEHLTHHKNFDKCQTTVQRRRATVTHLDAPV